MKTIELFRLYLLHNSRTSHVTVKNYVSDVNKFINWYEKKYQQDFSPALLNQEIITDFINYHKSLITSTDIQNSSTNQSNPAELPAPRSFERYLSSLRRFASYLVEARLLDTNPFEQISNLDTKSKENKDPWNLKKFKDFLYLSGATSVTSKNYMVDINAFTTWLEYKGYQTQNISNYIECINSDNIAEYKKMLINELGLSEATVNRKMSSIRKYLSYGKKTGLITPPPVEVVPVLPIYNEQAVLNEILPEAEITSPDAVPTDFSLDELKVEEVKYSSFAPLRLLQKISSPYFMLEDKAATLLAGYVKEKNISFATPKINPTILYKRYHNLSFVRYLHLGVLVIFTTIIGSVLYNGFFNEASQNKTLAVASPPRTLSFQGVLTDNNNNPITSKTNVRFQIYNNAESTGSASLLWQEVDTVTPDSNGVFSILLGNTSTTCSTPTQVQTSACAIPVSLFGNNSTLYLGITVESTPELTPRQQIATVPFASNAQTLEGMLPITDSNASQSNVILALDSSGNLTIGGSAAPTFQTSGGAFTLKGQGVYLKTNEGSNYDVKIEPDGIGKIDLRSPLVNNGDKGNIAPGGVEINDKAAILATESAVAAFIVNNDDVGDLFSASNSGNTKFTIQSTGDVYFTAGAVLDTLTTGTLEIGTNNTTTITLGRSGQGITLPNFTDQNGVLFGSYGTGQLAQATTTTANLCLVSGVSNPTWASCSSGNASTYWNQSNGALYPNNSTVDFFIGGQSTESAKFSVTNVNNGTPTASIAGNLIVMPNTAQSSGGKVGIGVANPTHTLQLWNDDAAKESTTTWTVTSDARTKTDVIEFSDGLNIITQINPVNFKYNGLAGTTLGKQGIGVIAQDVQMVAPYMIGEFEGKLHPNDTNNSKILDFNPHALFFISINAIKELNNSIQNLGKSITTGAVFAKNITADSISVAGDSVIIAGVSLRDYVRETVEEAVSTQQIIFKTKEIISPIATIDEIHTNIISPIAPDKPVVIKGNIAIEGNASVSGQLISANLSTVEATISGNLSTNSVISNELSVNNDATISGTLYANNIQADSIQGLDSKIVSAYRQQLAGLMASSSAIPNTNYQIQDTDYIDIASIKADFGEFNQGLIALGPSSFTQASFSDSISVGNTLFIGPNSINTVGTELAIQSLKQGAIDFLAGAVRIEVDGTLKVANDAYFAQDVSVKGKLKTNVISPTSDQDNVSFEIGNSKFEIGNSKHNPSMSVDSQGNIMASGSGTFAKLNVFKAAQAYALSDTEVVATGSAGTASIKPYKQEITVYNPNITEDSLVYITAVGDSSITPSLLRQLPGTSFTVGIPVLTNVEVRFNWIVIN